jgi:iron complex outermembrane receptor protein
MTPRISLLAALLLALPADAAAQAPRISPLPTASPEETGEIHGVVVDGERGTPIAGAVVLLPATGHREVSHADGAFHVVRVAVGRQTLRVERMGYAPASLAVDVSPGGRTAVRVEMRAAAIALDGVEAHGAPRAEIARPATVLAGAELRRRLASTVPATLAGQPGITLAHNGPGASQPVIRGLGGNRVSVLEDGQRTGDIAGSAADHGVMVDPLSAERVEVVRGPASLLHGGNALGGVVNVVRGEVPRALPDRPTGSLAVQGESAAEGLAAGGAVTAPLGRWAVRAEGSLRRLGDTRTPEGRLETSDLAAGTVALGLSRVGDAGWAGLAVRHHDTRYGVPGGFGGRDVPGAHVGGAYVEAERTAVRGEAGRTMRLGPITSLEARVNLVRFHQREMERGDDGGEFVGTRFVQHLGTVDLVARMADDGAAGLSLGARDREAIGAATGSRTAREWTAAGFAYRRASLGPIRLEGGARYDWTRVDPSAGPAVGGVPVRTRTFGSVSAAAAAVWEAGRGAELGARAARAFRTPSIEELFARGPHLAAFSYEIGNPELDAETGVGVDLFARVVRPRLLAEATVFRNDVDGYVHYAPTGALDPRFGRYPVYVARGTDARFRGAEALLRWEPLRGWAVEGAFGHVRADGRVDGRWVPLPAVPPAQGSLRLRRDVPRWFAEAGVSGAARQSRVAPGGDDGRPAEETTAGYLHVVGGAGLRIDAGAWLHTVTLQIDNALDAAWRDHTSRLRAVAPGAGINARLLYRVDF